MTDPAAWLRRPEPRNSARLRLICFPHAGGAASFYNSWSRLLPPWIELVAVQYPGREDRLRDPLIGDLRQLAGLITGALEELAGQPVALFGHSMGAAVAYEVACHLEEQRQQAPVHLFASSCWAPDQLKRTAIHQRDDDGLVAELLRLAPDNDALLQESELVELMLPTIRNDYRAIECYQPSGAVLTCAMTAMVGDQDPDITAEDMSGWQSLARGPFAMKVLAGGHFYLTAQREQVVAELVRSIA